MKGKGESNLTPKFLACVKWSDGEFMNQKGMEEEKPMLKESDTVGLTNMESELPLINADRGVQWTV